MDSFLEIYQKDDRLSNTNIKLDVDTVSSTSDMITALKSFSTSLQSLISYSTRPELCAIRDNMLADIAQFIYLLSFE